MLRASVTRGKKRNACSPNSNKYANKSMKLAGLFKPVASFRAQMVAFIAGMLVLTTIVLYLVSQRSEKRITEQIDQYVQATIEATEVVLRSLNEGKYLYNLVDPGRGGTLAVNSESAIRHILVVDSVTKEISDSTDRNDIGQRLDAAIPDLPIWQIGDLKRDELNSDERDRTIQFSFTTSRTIKDAAGKDATVDVSRTVIIVVSMRRFYRVVAAAARDRLIAISVLGSLMVALIAIFSKRLTQPITNLGQAARRITAGNLDFEVPVKGPEEVGALAKTFNEMLTVLRRSRELEEQLQRAERSAVIGRLASGIAHEIRNPLNFINLSIDHLRETFGPANEAQRAQYKHILTTIKDELARLNRLVSDFLSYGRPAKLKLRELDALSLIEEVRDLVIAKADEQGVKISIEAVSKGDGTGTKLNADPEQLKTCFSNLMINAIQAMPAGGELDVGLFPDQDRLEIEITDTGTGILPESLEQIFEPYYSTKETGIGLGLPLTKKIIEEHGGQIRVESEVGLGTTFIVTLPRQSS